MYPTDILRTIIDLLPDCRGMALACHWWYEVYAGTDDYQYWAGGRKEKYVLPKMIPDAWDESLGDLVVAENIPALDAARRHLPENMRGSVDRALVYLVIERDIASVAAYYQPLGLWNINFAQQCGAVRCLDLCLALMREQTITGLRSSIHCNAPATIDWMIRSGFSDIAGNWCRNHPYVITKTVVDHRLVDYHHLRGKSQWWYHMTFSDVPLPSFVFVVKQWPLDGIQWYMERTGARVSLRALIAAAESEVAERFVYLWKRACADARTQGRGYPPPERILVLAAETLTVYDIDDIVDMVEIVGARKLNIRTPVRSFRPTDAEYRKILAVDSDAATQMANYMYGGYGVATIELFREHGIVLQPYIDMLEYVGGDELERTVAALVANGVRICDLRVSGNVWKCARMHVRARTRMHVRRETAEYLVGLGFDAGRVEIRSRTYVTESV